jgi:hypothetical protein
LVTLSSEPSAAAPALPSSPAFPSKKRPRRVEKPVRTGKERPPFNPPGEVYEEARQDEPTASALFRELQSFGREFPGLLTNIAPPGEPTHLAVPFKQFQRWRRARIRQAASQFKGGGHHGKNQ